jgi:hypothetical protein
MLNNDTIEEKEREREDDQEFLLFYCRKIFY